MSDFKDMTGERFGSLTVIKYVGDRKWLCQCDCTRTKEISGYSLRAGKTKTCGMCNKKEVNVGDKFGEWTVISKVEGDNTKVHCKCSCGKERDVNMYTLLDGRSTGCGHTMNQDRIIDITGQRFGKLVAQKHIGRSKWKCKCDCGNDHITNRFRLISGISTQCRICAHGGPEDLKGQRFGKLVAMKYAGHKSWVCHCECGNDKTILSVNLKFGGVVSCGCILNHFIKEDIEEKINELNSNLGRPPYTDELAVALGVSDKMASYYIVRHDLRHLMSNSFSSSMERELAEFIKENCDSDVILGDRKAINPYELDIYIPDKKLAIEFNGNYWHSELNKDMYYHQTKTVECAKKGIQLIHVFEYEWDNPVKRQLILRIMKSKLNNDRKDITDFYTQQCKEDKALEFLSEYSLKTFSGIDEMYFGCYSKENDEILGILAFKKSEEYGYEIADMCWRPDVNVINGAETLFNNAVKQVNADEIVVYPDLTKFTGNVYYKLGFKAIEGKITEPKYVLWDGDKNEVDFDADEEYTPDAGLYKIYDSGSIKMLWRATENA